MLESPDAKYTKSTHGRVTYKVLNALQGAIALQGACHRLSRVPFGTVGTLPQG